MDHRKNDLLETARLPRSINIGDGTVQELKSDYKTVRCFCDMKEGAKKKWQMTDGQASPIM
jgi:hypothetical protein